MKKRPITKISIALDPVVINKLEKGRFNKSKLVDWLLDIYFKKSKKSRI